MPCRLCLKCASFKARRASPIERYAKQIRSLKNGATEKGNFIKIREGNVMSQQF